MLCKPSDGCSVMPLAEVREMRERLLGPLMPYLREAMSYGNEYGRKAFYIIADYAMGFLSRREAERRLRALLAKARRERGKHGR